jgi:hypothetical protein
MIFFVCKTIIEQPVKLIALTPSFHNDSFTDKKYHQLDFCFFTFAVLEVDNHVDFQMTNAENEEKIMLEIDFQRCDPEETLLPKPPRFFLNAVHQDWRSEEERRRILQMREIILRLDSRVKEFNKNPWLTYGTRQSEVFAEFYCKSSLFGSYHVPVLILKIPKLHILNRRIPQKNNRIRLALGISDNWKTADSFWHLSTGIKKVKRYSVRNSHFEQGVLKMIEHLGLPYSQERANSLYGLEDALLENLITLAYHSWLEKLSLKRQACATSRSTSNDRFSCSSHSPT